MKNSDPSVELVKKSRTKKYEELPKEEAEERLVKKKFMRKAQSMQPVLMDPLNIQTGIAASIISDMIESSLI